MRAGAVQQGVLIRAKEETWACVGRVKEGSCATHSPEWIAFA